MLASGLGVSHRVNPYIALPTMSAMLVGRERETEVLSGLLACGREGRSAVLVLRGEPGTGKSSLLDLAVQLAEGFRVLRARG